MGRVAGKGAGLGRQTVGARTARRALVLALALGGLGLLWGGHVRMERARANARFLAKPIEVYRAATPDERRTRAPLSELPLPPVGAEALSRFVLSLTEDQLDRLSHSRKIPVRGFTSEQQALLRRAAFYQVSHGWDVGASEGDVELLGEIGYKRGYRGAPVLAITFAIPKLAGRIGQGKTGVVSTLLLLPYPQSTRAAEAPE